MDKATYSRLIDGQHDLDVQFFARLALEMADLAHRLGSYIEADFSIKTSYGEHGTRTRRSADMSILFDGRTRYPDSVEVQVHGPAAGGPEHLVLSFTASTTQSHFIYAAGHADLAREGFDLMEAAFERRRRLAIPAAPAVARRTRPQGDPTKVVIGFVALFLGAMLPAIATEPWQFIFYLPIAACLLLTFGRIMRADVVDEPVTGATGTRPRTTIDLGDDMPPADDARMLEHQPTVPLDLGKD